MPQQSRFKKPHQKYFSHQRLPPATTGYRHICRAHTYMAELSAAVFQSCSCQKDFQTAEQ